MNDHRPSLDGEGADLLWQALGQLHDSAIVADARAYAAARHERILRRRRFWQLLVPVASAGLATAAVCVSLLVYSGKAADPILPAVAFTTGVGEIREYRLRDGSIAVLDTNTRLVARFSAKQRELTLLSGHAHFDVVHNPERAFIVSFGRNSVTALGTSFDVTALPGRNAVALLSGKVLVVAKVADAAPPRKVTLTTGLGVGISDSGQFTRPARIDMASAGMWRRGQLDFTDTRVAEALELVNRYSTTRITVRENAVLEKRISGVFKAGDTEAAIDALTTYFDLRIVSRSPNEIVLGR